MSDNALGYIHGRSLRELLAGMRFSTSAPGAAHPRANGKVEPDQQTLQRRWPYVLKYASSQSRPPSLTRWAGH